MSGYLQIQDVSLAFGGIKALSNVDCAVESGEIFGVIGPNGAGKTTLFNCIAGVYRPSQGGISFKGERISGSRVDAIARRGVGRTFQAATVFRDGTALDNLMRAGDFAAHPYPGWRRWFGLDEGASKAELLERAVQTLGFIGLDAQADAPAAAMSYGHQKILGLGMALMTSPELMLMDEPAAGLNSSEKVEMKRLISRICREKSITVVVVEHDMGLIMEICDRIMVLNRGVAIATGAPAEIQSNSSVIEAYLGVDHDAA